MADHLSTLGSETRPAPHGGMRWRNVGPHRGGRVVAVARIRQTTRRSLWALRELKEPGRQTEAEGREFHPRTEPDEATPDPKAQRNFTDPESRIMLNSDKAYVQGYNGQAAVDVDSMFVVAADLTAMAAGAPQLMGVVDQTSETMGERPQGVLADAGDCSEENMRALAERGIEAFIPPRRVKHRERREMTPPRGRIPKSATERDRMLRKLRTVRGRARYDRRKETVEPVFGYIKQVQGFRQVLVRGRDKVRSMWRFECAVYNLMKMVRQAAACANAGRTTMTTASGPLHRCHHPATGDGSPQTE